MNRDLAALLARENQNKRTRNFEAYEPWTFRQLPTSAQFECVYCKDGLFGQQIVTEIGVGDDHAFVNLCTTCGAVDGPWIKSEHYGYY